MLLFFLKFHCFGKMDFSSWKLDLFNSLVQMHAKKYPF